MLGCLHSVQSITQRNVDAYKFTIDIENGGRKGNGNANIEQNGQRRGI